MGTAIPAYSSGGRISLFFNVQDDYAGLTAVFNRKLGYTGTGDKVGCWADLTLDLKPESGK